MTDARGDLLLAGAFAALLLAVATVGPTVVDARPAYEIPVERGTEAEGFGSATADPWTEVPAATVSLSAAGASVPAADDVTVEETKLQAVRTDRRLYLRLSWADATVDRSTNATRAFADAVAVQVPANASARPPIAMGSAGNPVNVWYWSADDTTEELLAGGPGSTTRFDPGTVTTDATRADGRWHVVLSRPLDAPNANRTAIPDDADMDVALAVWNGSNAERSGKKSVSEWHYLALGPGPQGPPYQTILWIVAGLAIVGSALVTIEGVRRTRGE
ncbi:ethylbenzene dehydrogenase-related protein [Salinirubellus sp. GCM10025818]|uniref:ethylbenzene dehydrogenase-related protein n=1 Tax=Salinirubellus TaxID=2162630 RepID=UPI0030CF4EBA